MTTLSIETAAVFEPLLRPSRYKGIWGGRGSGKSHFFAELLVETCMLRPGTRALCVREVQRSLKESAKRLIEDKIEKLGVGSSFEVLQSEIRTPGDGIISFTGMQDHTAESVKSYEGYDLAWIEEARSLSQRSLTLLRPTLRKDGSEIWASWNPFNARDPIDQLLRGDNPPPDAVVVKANWSDNPWFPKTLDEERQYDERHRSDQYGHIWEGEYARVYDGAYFASQLNEARKAGRIGALNADPLMTYRAVWDIGGTGSKSDACAIWVCQFVGPQIRVLDYYEAVGQPLATHVNWLRDNGYGKALCVLPHDGVKHDAVYDVTYEGALKKAGFEVAVIPNQGRGAALKRIEVARRLFPNIWFDEQRCRGGIEALGAYHERKDEVRGIGLGPEHDWSSHGADAFGLMCIAHEQPSEAGWSALPIRRTVVV